MTLADFHDDVAEELKRGAAHTAMIPAWTRRAAFWIERAITLQHMQRFVTFTNNPDLTQPRALPLPEPRLKEFLFIRITHDAGQALEEYGYLTKCDPRDILRAEEDRPTKYWLDAYDFIWLDKTPPNAYTFEMSYTRFTTWPTDTTETPWLVTYAEDALLARTMLNAAPAVRMSEEMRGRYREMLQESMQLLSNGQYSLENSDASDAMNYGDLS